MRHVPKERVNAMRAFNRFWTKQIGILGAHILETPYSLTEARVLFELAQSDVVAVADLRSELDLDAGYLSRILGHFRTNKLVTTEPSSNDPRRQMVRLTASGRRVLEELSTRSAALVSSILSKVTDEEQRRLVGAMSSIRQILDRAPRSSTGVLRPLGPGDLGWVVQQHGLIYTQEFGWDDSFETLVAQVVADYARQRDPRRDNAWIAELDGESVGCVFCVRKDTKTAQLRLLLVKPQARGLGVGTRLVEECVRFACRAGFQRIELWSMRPLTAARRIYERSDFELVGEKKVHLFGQDLMEQRFSLALSEGAGSRTLALARN